MNFLLDDLHVAAIQRDIAEAVGAAHPLAAGAHTRVLMVSPSALFARSGGQRNMALLTVGLARLGLQVSAFGRPGPHAQFLEGHNIASFAPQPVYVEANDVPELYVRLCIFRQAWLLWREQPHAPDVQQAARLGCDQSAELLTLQPTSTTCLATFDWVSELPVLHEAFAMAVLVVQFRACVAQSQAQVVVVDLAHHAMMAVFSGLAASVNVLWYVQSAELHPDRLIAAYAMRLLACSRTVMAEKFGPDASQLSSSLIPNGVSQSKFVRKPRGTRWREQQGIAPDTLVVAQIGAVIPNKDANTVVKAFSLWHQRYPRACLVFVGHEDEEYGRTVRTRIDALGLHAAVYFLGERGDVDALLSEFDVVISASWSEGYGLAAAEAMAAAKPVIFSDIPSLRALGGDAALYFPVGDAHALAHQLTLVEGNSERIGRSQRVHEQALRCVADVGTMLSLFADACTAPSV